MVKLYLRFLDYKDKQSIEVNELDGIISIFTRNDADGVIGSCIHLNKSTAIKFAKTLRTEINKIES